MSSAPAPALTFTPSRVFVFVDYWNFQLTLNEKEAAAKGISPNDCRFEIAWAKLGPWLAARAAKTVGVTPHSYEGMNIYASHNPAEKKFLNWVENWLQKQPGIHVDCRERKPKASPKCSECHEYIHECPHCHQRIRATQEKGVDTLIATDMIRLAWEDAYDIAVLATLDRDLIPAVEFLKQKGIKVIQAGFPPKGADLAKASWGAFDAHENADEIRRPPNPKK